MDKIGAIVVSDGKSYKRKQPGVNLPTDFMTDEEIEELSGEVKIYYEDDPQNQFVRYYSNGLKKEEKTAEK